MLDKKNFYINGQWVKPNSSEEINVIDPATEDNCAVISLGNKADVDMAVNAAKDAYQSWAFSSKEERIGLLEKLYDKLERLNKPKFHENGRKKRTTKADKIKMEATERAYWKEHYVLFPKDKPKKRKSRKKNANV